ncbi:MAG: DNA mismatch repair protein MutS [Chloroflexi bacterium]|nr:DNA mismatch repair protein MutS [Chloroflexota bacterium]
MTFYSILFARPEDRPTGESSEAPDFFTDLNLDQIVAAVTAGKQEYELTPLFYAPLTAVDAILYRQEIAQDLADETLMADINTFADQMSLIRRYLGMLAKLYYQRHREGWFLEAVLTYGAAVTQLAIDLGAASLRSPGLLAFRDYMTAYAASAEFTLLLAEARQVRAELAAITYGIIIHDSVVKVCHYEGESDYSVEVEATFAKFKQGAVKDYRSKLTIASGMNHVEAKILDLVAKLHPEAFDHLSQFCGRHTHFLDETIRTFDREVQFYIAYLSFIADIQRAGLSFCYPQISWQRKEVYDYAGFDLALAAKRVHEDAPVVVNDFYLKDGERILIVSGPNQGGKTTFARTFGQLHYLASLGCPVPGRQAQLYLCDRIFTHFEREENMSNLRGKLQDDLVRIDAILKQATPHSILIMNEIFASTTLQDALFLSQQIEERIMQLDLLCVWVTFIDELATAGEKTVSMVSTVAPDNPAERTYKILRRSADGLAYAMSIAEKHGLTYASIMERIPA